VNQLLRPSTTEAHFAASVTKHSDRLQKCVKSPYRSRSIHNWSLLSKDLVWSNILWTKLYFLCLLWGTDKNVRRAEYSPRVKDPWPTMVIGAEISANRH
jgi:hypothetical protein